MYKAKFYVLRILRVLDIITWNYWIYYVFKFMLFYCWMIRLFSFGFCRLISGFEKITERNWFFFFLISCNFIIQKKVDKSATCNKFIWTTFYNWSSTTICTNQTLNLKDPKTFAVYYWLHPLLPLLILQVYTVSLPLCHQKIFKVVSSLCWNNL